MRKPVINNLYNISSNTSSKHNIAIIGSGYWGRNLVRNYFTIGALNTICDTNDSLLNDYKRQYPSVSISTNYEELLKNKSIKGIVVATPAETHFYLAKQALLANKHVFVEKPLVLYEREAQELIKLANEKNRVLMVGHLLQYHPIFVKLKELASNDELGRMNYIYSNRLNLGKIRREENILWSFAPHDISMILSLTGEEPQRVTATGGNYLNKDLADVTTTHLDFPSGRKAHIFVSWLHPFKEQKLIVVGDRKMAVFDDTKPWKQKLLLYPHQINWEDDLPVPTRADAEAIDVPKEEPLRLECEHFLECIATGRKPITDGAEGIRVLKILKASQLSLDNDGMPVKLSSSSIKSTRLKTESNMTKINRLNRYTDSDCFIHSTAEIDSNVTISPGTKIWHFSHILSGSNIGENCNIGQNVVIGPDVSVGKQCKIQNNVSVYKGVTLKDGVFCGPSMVFSNVYNPRAEINKMDQVRSTLVRKGATIGANATIICGITIGQYAFIGAGAVVTRDVPNFALIVGNPAKQTGWMCRCGERLDESLACKICGDKYRKNNQELSLSQNIES